MLDPSSTDNSTLLSSKSQGLTLNRTATDMSNRSSAHKYHDENWCTYCKKPRHTKEQCWKLHGKLFTNSREWRQKGGQLAPSQRQAYMSTQDSTQVFGGLSMDEIEKLNDLLRTVEIPAPKSSLIPQLRVYVH